MGFRTLRVINQDWVKAGKGFPTHGHRDMEILTYVLEGVLEHRDSMDNFFQMKPGDVQRMSAGTGVRHSEHNGSKDDALQLLQIWIEPRELGRQPSYEQKFFSREEKRGRLCSIASPDSKEGSLWIGQNARMYASVLNPSESISHSLPSDRGAWVQLIRGELRVNDTKLLPGDGAAITDEPNVELQAASEAEFLFFDLD